MPGGGYWRLAPDDSELAMCMLRGLVAGQGKLDLFHHALYYGYWVYHRPFDLGGTIANGLQPLVRCLQNPDPNIA